MKIGIQCLHTSIEEVEETRVIALDSRAQVIGYVSVRSVGRQSAWFSELFVVPGKRKNGVGTKLVNRCAEIAKQNNCETLSASIAPNNVAVLDFYRQLGFVVADHYGVDEENLLITKIL